MANATEPRPVDPAIWRACAGTSVRIPSVDSRVYYFPQGHAEQSSSPPIFSPRVSSQPMILCHVISVRLLANPDTDEVFVKIRLVPVDRMRDARFPDASGEVVTEDVGDDDRIVSFAKILTPSDANNGGGFSVPRFCADSIFPPLNFAADPPVQNIVIRDVQGMAWEFRHIYRGTPRRHLLTTGWSKFVNNKKLIAGDSVVFMRNRRTGELFVGVRRAVRANVDYGMRWNCPVGMGRGNGNEVEEEEVVTGGGYEGFSRNGRGRVSPECVAEAAELAANRMGFEIVYYPKAGSADFVVKADVVDESLRMFWAAGTRVKMAIETEDSSRMTWFQGTVSSALVPEKGAWRGSPWRVLQVAWDEPEVIQHVKRVSPWQVEYVVTTPSLQTAFPHAKKYRVEHNPGLLPDGDGDFFFSMNSMMGHLNSSYINYSSFPAGMQGARQERLCVSGLSSLICDNAHRVSSDQLVGNKIPEMNTVCTELNIGSSQSDNLSPDSQGSVHFLGTEVGRKRRCDSSVKVGISSFQLFGKIIHLKEPVEDGFSDVGCTEDDSSKACKETEAVNNQLDLSLTDTQICSVGLMLNAKEPQLLNHALYKTRGFI